MNAVSDKPRSESPPDDELHPDKHPSASAAGAAGGAVVGGLIGALGGPVGLVMGATAGTILGGNAALNAAEATERIPGSGGNYEEESESRATSDKPPFSPPRDALNQGGFSSAGQRQVLAEDKAEVPLPKLSKEE